jgi:hypothetical protein
VDAVETARYLVNMCPSSTLVDMTPNEVWSGKNPLMAHLKVFGCDAIMHGMKGYKHWDTASRRTMYSKDVVFREFEGKYEPKEVVHIENNLDTMQFELRNEEDDSDESNESKEEVEKLTQVVRR